MFFDTTSHPLQLPKVEFAPGFAVNLIKVPPAYLATERLPRPSIPTGVLLTSPFPFPDLVTTSVCIVACSEGPAITDCRVFTTAVLISISRPLASGDEAPTSTEFVVEDALGSNAIDEVSGVMSAAPPRALPSLLGGCDPCRPVLISAGSEGSLPAVVLDGMCACPSAGTLAELVSGD